MKTKLFLKKSYALFFNMSCGENTNFENFVDLARTQFIHIIFFFAVFLFTVFLVSKGAEYIYFAYTLKI